MKLLIAILALILTYITGTIAEKDHYKNIRQREVALYKKPFISFAKRVNGKKQIAASTLVSSSVVIGCDHFKHFLAKLRNIFGGNVAAYESVLDRGRREAILRIREQAEKLKADIVLNIKLETVMLDNQNEDSVPKVCVTAYGTAVKYAKDKI